MVLLNSGASQVVAVDGGIHLCTVKRLQAFGGGWEGTPTIAEAAPEQYHHSPERSHICRGQPSLGTGPRVCSCGPSWPSRGGGEAWRGKVGAGLRRGAGRGRRWSRMRRRSSTITRRCAATSPKATGGASWRPRGATTPPSKVKTKFTQMLGSARARCSCCERPPLSRPSLPDA